MVNIPNGYGSKGEKAGWSSKFQIIQAVKKRKFRTKKEIVPKNPVMVSAIFSIGDEFRLKLNRCGLVTGNFGVIILAFVCRVFLLGIVIAIIARASVYSRMAVGRFFR
jgi:hypothetical protein